MPTCCQGPQLIATTRDPPAGGEGVEERIGRRVVDLPGRRQHGAHGGKQHEEIQRQSCFAVHRLPAETSSSTSVPLTFGSSTLAALSRDLTRRGPSSTTPAAWITPLIAPNLPAPVRSPVSCRRGGTHRPKGEYLRSKRLDLDKLANLPLDTIRRADRFEGVLPSLPGGTTSVPPGPAGL